MTPPFRGLPSFRRRGRLGLQHRLLLSHGMVLLVGICALVIVGKVFASRLFLLHLQQIERQGVNLAGVRQELVKGSEFAWSRAALWSILVGTGSAGCLSSWISQRILKPLQTLEQAIQTCGQGEIKAGVSASEIPELAQLAASFNRMVTSLETMEHRRREMVVDVTHELRTPLTVMRGYLEGLQEGRIAPSPEVYDHLVRETRRLCRLVENFQDLSKVEAGYLSIDPQPLDLGPILVTLVQRFGEQVMPEDVEMRLEVTEELPWVRADRERVEQILVNLLGNALHHTTQGRVTLRAWRETAWVWVAVQDTGEGIAVEDLPWIFERFWRSQRSRQTDKAGTGVGLAITRHLVELQGGSIQVESQVGRGSCFRFCLPLAQGTSRPPDGKNPEIRP